MDHICHSEDLRLLKNNLRLSFLSVQAGISSVLYHEMLVMHPRAEGSPCRCAVTLLSSSSLYMEGSLIINHRLMTELLYHFVARLSVQTGLLSPCHIPSCMHCKITCPGHALGRVVSAKDGFPQIGSCQV